MEIISYNTPKAKKEHNCDWCGEKINIGSKYERSFIKDGNVWVWKNHFRCSKIAEELKMFDGDPVDEYFFKETVNEEYQKIMSEKHTEIYKSETFKTPTFKEQLDFVCEFHKVEFGN